MTADEREVMLAAKWAQCEDTITSLKAEIRAIHDALTESRHNDRTAMGYLSDIRSALQFDGDFPALVAYCESLKAQEPFCFVSDDGDGGVEIRDPANPHNINLIPLFTTQQPAAVPAGFKLVPVEPTDEMKIAGGDDAEFCHACGYDNGAGSCEPIYKAMIAAAPEAPQAQDKYGERLDWIAKKFFVSSWNGVVGSGCKTNWRIAGDHRHTVALMTESTFLDSIDQAMKESK